MKNIKDFGSFLNESVASKNPEQPIWIGSTVGSGFNKAKPLETIKKIKGVLETKLKDGSSQFVYTNPDTKVKTWSFYANGRAFNHQTKGMYSYFYKDGFIDFNKDSDNPYSGTPAKVGDFLVISDNNPNNTDNHGSGKVISAEKNEKGYWRITVKGSFTEDGGKSWKTGTINLNSQTDDFKGNGLVGVDVFPIVTVTP